SLQRTFKKSFTSFSHSTRNKTRDGLIRVRNIRALNGRFNTSITHAYSIVIGSKRSEERRVGKECRSRWSPDGEKKKEKAGSRDECRANTSARRKGRAVSESTATRGDTSVR